MADIVQVTSKGGSESPESFPLLAIYFEHSGRGSISRSTLKFLAKHRKQPSGDPKQYFPQVTSSSEVQKLLLYLLRRNAILLSQSDSVLKPEEEEEGFELGGILPLHVVRPALLEELNRQFFGRCVSCAMLGEEGKLSRCKQCRTVVYCSKGASLPLPSGTGLATVIKITMTRMPDG